MKLVAEGLRFPEGPVALADGCVLVAEIQGESIACVDPVRGTVERIGACPGGPNGLAIGPDGALYICNNGGAEWKTSRGLLTPGIAGPTYTRGSSDRLDLATGEATTLYANCGTHRLSAPNDLVFDEAGGIWFTDMGKNQARARAHGGVYYAQPDGSVVEEVIYPLTTPNGIGLSPDGAELYVAETVPGRLWGFAVAGPGRLAPVSKGPHRGRLVHGFDGYQLLDSLAVDSEGNIAVATLVTGAISVLSPAGRLLEQICIPDGDPFVTNICFGGPELRTAYISSSGRGRLYATEWPCPGLRLRFP